MNLSTKRILNIGLFTVFAITISCTNKTIKSDGSVKEETANEKVAETTEPLVLYKPINDSLVVFDSISGYINDDEFLDFILVCHSKNESETEYDEYERVTYIYVGLADGSYRQHTVNIGAVLCKHCGGVYGDPYDGFSINPKNGFSIVHYGGSNYRWTIYTDFHYTAEMDRFFLVETVNTSFTTFDPDKEEVSTKTTENFGVVYFNGFDVNDYRE